MSSMQDIGIEKVTLNIGCGKDQSKVEKAMKLLQSLTGAKPTKTITQKRIPEWGLRPGLPIGCKVTIRHKVAKELLTRLLKAKDDNLDESCFNDNGSIAFGIVEYIDIPDAKYDPEIGIIGLQACVTLKRPGYRLKTRKQRKKKIPEKHRISHDNAIEYLKSEFKITVGEEE